MGAELVSQIIVLTKRERGEKFWLLEALSPEKGCLSFLVRKTSKAGKTTIPDLFDFAEVRLKAKGEEDFYFLTEYHLVQRGQKIAQHYQNFHWAMRFALLLSRNAQHLTHPEVVFNMMKKSIQAWMDFELAEIIYLKSVFVFAKNEGFAVQQGWLGSLSHAQKETVETLLYTPLREMEKEESTSALIELLERWLVRHCEFIIPSAGA